MNHLTSLEEQSSALVKSIGCIKVGENIYLKDLFIYKNISIWEVYEPIIAIYLIPQIISGKRKLFNKYIYLLNNLFRYSLSFNFKNKINKKNNYWLFTCFSNYMYDDTILPLVQYCKKYNSNFEYITIGGLTNSKFSIRNIIYLLAFISKIKYRIFYSKKENIDNIPISKKDLNFIIDYLLYNLIPKNLSDIENALNLFDVRPPQVILSVDVANPASRIYTVLAKKYNIPSIDMQYGHYEPTDIEWRFSISDKIFVWGQYYLDLFEKNHFIKREKLEITGSPKFDYLNNKYHTPKSNNLNNKIKILFASTYTISSYENIENYEVIKNFKYNLVNEISNLSNLELIIKPHPLEDTAWLNNIKLSKNIIVTDKKSSIKQLISSCEYFISFGSTSTFDALLQNKICFSVNYDNTKKNQDIFNKNNLVNLIYNDFDLKKILHSISTKSFYESVETKINRDKFLKNAITTYDKNNNDSSSHLISSLVNSYLN